MRFAFLTLGYHPDQIGGAYRYVREAAVHLARRGHEVAAIYPGAPSTPLAVERREGVTLRRYPDQTGAFWQNWRAENSLARQHLLAWEEGGAAPSVTVACHAYFARALMGRPYVSLFTGPWAAEYRYSRQAVARPFWRRLFESLVAQRLQSTERRHLERASQILTISDYYLKQLPVWHPAALPPVRNISGGVDGARFERLPDRAGCRARLDVADGDFLFLTVRRLDPRMGLRHLLEAFARVAPSFPQARLAMAGDGPQAAELAELVSHLRLGGRVRMLGRVDDAALVHWLNAADCTVMPSIDLEGFGLATVESLACGTPVLGSDAGATAEILRPLNENLVFAAGSPDALAGRLAEVLKQPAGLPPRDRCREYALARYAWENVASAIEQHCSAAQN